jgi:endonuclease YncB( thermonuclease family)
MRNCLKIILLFIAFLLILPTISIAAELKVIRIYEGDTIKAESHDIVIKVRLVGIDAPEISRKKRQPGQSYSQQAKKFLFERGDKEYRFHYEIVGRKAD